MDVVITSALQKSCLSSSSRSSDFILRQAETKKFSKESKSSFPIHNSNTQQFIPLALNNMGLRGPHFTAALKELATQLLTRLEGCPLMKGPFALSHMGALKKTLHTWGASLTWTAQREFAAHVIRSVDSLHACNAFHTSASQMPGDGVMGARGDGG